MVSSSKTIYKNKRDLLIVLTNIWEVKNGSYIYSKFNI